MIASGSLFHTFCQTSDPKRRDVLLVFTPQVSLHDIIALHYINTNERQY